MAALTPVVARSGSHACRVQMLPMLPSTRSCLPPSALTRNKPHTSTLLSPYHMMSKASTPAYSHTSYYDDTPSHSAATRPSPRPLQTHSPNTRPSADTLAAHNRHSNSHKLFARPSRCQQSHRLCMQQVLRFGQRRHSLSSGGNLEIEIEKSVDVRAQYYLLDYTHICIVGDGQKRTGGNSAATCCQVPACLFGPRNMQSSLNTAHLRTPTIQYSTDATFTHVHMWPSACKPHEGILCGGGRAALAHSGQHAVQGRRAIHEARSTQVPGHAAAAIGRPPTHRNAQPSMPTLLQRCMVVYTLVPCHARIDSMYLSA
jgi:hypothetical protein